MKTIPNNLLKEKNKIASSAPWIVLAEIYLKDGEDILEIDVARNTENINYDDKEYIAYPFNIELSSENSDGSLPQLNMTIFNGKEILSEYIDKFAGGIDSKVKIRIINTEHLEEGDYLTYDYSIVSCSQNVQSVIITLSGKNLLLLNFPRNLFIADFCRFRFKDARCGYTGGIATCPRTLDACKDRNNQTRFGGFPGLNRSNFKLL